MILMFVCTMLVAAVAAYIATLAAFFEAQQQSGLTFVLWLVLSPGWVLSFEVISQYLPHTAGWVDARPFVIAFGINLAYYFTWIFAFAIRSERKWREKRVARIDA